MREKRNWHFEWLTTWDEVWSPSFVAQWKTWMDCSSHAHVFFEPGIVRAWIACFRRIEHCEPRFVVAEHVSGSKVFYPLVLAKYGWKDSWCRVLLPAGGDDFDYQDPIFTDMGNNEIIPGFWNAISEEVREHFGRSVDQVVVPRVRASCVGSYMGFRERSKAPFIDLRGVTGLDNILSKGPKSIRQDLGRQTRRLEELGSLRLKVYGINESSLATAAFDGFVRAYCDRWRTRTESASLYGQILHECLPENYFHLSVLESNGVAISWHIGFLHKARFYYYKVAYDMQFAKYSPGKVHLMKLVEEALRRSATVFDFLRGQEEYKYHWTETSVGLYQLQIDGTRLWSQLALKARKVLWANRERYRRLYQRLHHIR